MRKWAISVLASILILGMLGLSQDAEAQPILIETVAVDFPEGVAVDSFDNVYVSEDFSGKIIKFNNDLSVKTTFVSGLTGLVDVAVDSFDNVYVSEQALGQVKKFSSAGTPILPSALGFINTKGVGVDSFDNVYVGEIGNGGKVTKFTTFPTVTSSFPVTGMNIPLHFAFDSSGNVYVTEDTDGIVNKFSSTGVLLETLAGFTNPRGIAVDSSDNFYLIESGTGTIHKFTNFPNGQSTFLTGLSGPQDIAFDSSGDFFVTETPVGQVKKFSSAGAPVGSISIPIDSTSLLVAESQSFSWMIPVLLSGIGIGLFVVSRKSENS